MTPNEQAFLHLLGFSEGTCESPVTRNDGYDVIVSGIHGPAMFTDYSSHPFAHGRPPQVINHAGLCSTASGRYQIILKTWYVYSVTLGLKDFSPASQDAIALALVKDHGGLPALLAGNVIGAMKACSSTWASLPGSPYGQPTHPLSVMLAEWKKLTHG